MDMGNKLLIFLQSNNDIVNFVLSNEIIGLP